MKLVEDPLADENDGFSVAQMSAPARKNAAGAHWSEKVWLSYIAIVFPFYSPNGVTENPFYTSQSSTISRTSPGRRIQDFLRNADRSLQGQSSDRLLEPSSNDRNRSRSYTLAWHPEFETAGAPLRSHVSKRRAIST